MTAAIFENAPSELRPARIVRARRPVLRPTLAVQLPEYVPAWLMPAFHDDPRFVALARMDTTAIGVALVASGTDWTPYRRHTASRHPIEHYIDLAMRGLDAIGAPACRRASADYRLLARTGQTGPSGQAAGIGPAGSLVERMFTAGRCHADRRHALSLGVSIVTAGFQHEGVRNERYQGRCTHPGLCGHCYPENFPPAEVAA